MTSPNVWHQWLPYVRQCVCPTTYNFNLRLVGWLSVFFFKMLNPLSVWPTFSTNQTNQNRIFLKKKIISISWRQPIHRCLDVLQCMELLRCMSIKSVRQYYAKNTFVQYLHHKTPQTIAALAPLRLLLLQTLIYVL